MPKLPIDHSNSIIYKLVKNDDYDNANIYIGSTTDFIRRKNSHKNCCNNEKRKEYNEKKYKYIRDNGGWEEWNMIEVEKFPCNDKREAEAREEYWRCHFNSQLNSIRAYRTDDEYKKYQKKYQKTYRETHKEKYLEYQKQYNNKKNNITDSSSDDSTECITH